MSATIAAILYTKRVKNDGTYPVKVRVTYQRVRKYYKTGIDLNLEDWEKIQGSKTRKPLVEIKDKIYGFVSKAKAVVDSMTNFSFSAFESKFKEVRHDRTDVYASFEAAIQKLNEEDRPGTAFSYFNSLQSLKLYKASLSFEEITPDFLKKYEKWMLQRKKSVTTIAIYLRNVRTLFNNGIAEGTLRQDAYPFGKRLYQIPGSRNVKKALSLEDIEKIYHHVALPGSIEEKARDFWIFSYLSSGINPKDICKLRYSDIQKDKVSFIRSKTMNTKKADIQSITFFLSEDSQNVIDKWGVKTKDKNAYIFPVLIVGLTAKQELEKVRQFTKTINKGLEKICNQVGIEIKVTSYFARHSFSTVMKRGGASVEMISEALGHSDIQTTKNYLDSFEDNVKKEFVNVLTNFKK